MTLYHQWFSTVPTKLLLLTDCIYLLSDKWIIFKKAIQVQLITIHIVGHSRFYFRYFLQFYLLDSLHEGIELGTHLNDPCFPLLFSSWVLVNIKVITHIFLSRTTLRALSISRKFNETTSSSQKVLAAFFELKTFSKGSSLRFLRTYFRNYFWLKNLRSLVWRSKYYSRTAIILQFSL